MNALLITNDLMITSHVGGAAERVGVGLQTAPSGDAAVDACAVGHLDLVLVDLGLAALEIGPLVEKLRDLADPPGRIVAFGPHVHAAKLEAARQAGCDKVLSRGQLHGGIDNLLRSLDAGC